MTWYNVGTIAVTNNSTAVTGTGTAWVGNARAGHGLRMPNGDIYEIASINSATSMTLVRPYGGATAAGQAYEVVPVQGYNRDLATNVDALVSSFVSVRDGIGTGQFPDGTAAAPAIRFSGDIDTGFYRVSSDVLGVAVGTLQTARFGNNTVPALVLNKNYGGVGHSSTALAFNLNGGAGGGYLAGYSADINLAHNCEYVSGSAWVARHASASNYQQIAAAHAWFSNTGLTAGSPFTPIETMRLTAAGQLLIGRSGWSGIGKLNVEGGADFTGGNVLLCRDTGNTGIGVGSAAAKLHVARSGPGEAIRFGSATYQMGYLGEDEATNTVVIGNRYADAANCNISFRINGAATEKLRIAANAVHAGNDNLTSSGRPAFRWDTVFAGTSTISTSDERLKAWRGGAAEAELRAARRIIRELGFYQWNDAIDLKGVDGARYHFGVRAQAVWTIMAEEGLVDPLDDAGKPGACSYAFLCFDEWDEETTPEMVSVEIPAVLDGDGVELEPAHTERHPTGETQVVLPAGNRFGLRTDQLALFLIAAQEQRLAALEAAAA